MARVINMLLGCRLILIYHILCIDIFDAHYVACGMRFRMLKYRTILSRLAKYMNLYIKKIYYCARIRCVVFNAASHNFYGQLFSKALQAKYERRSKIKGLTEEWYRLCAMMSSFFIWRCCHAKRKGTLFYYDKLPNGCSCAIIFQSIKYVPNNYYAQGTGE